MGAGKILIMELNQLSSQIIKAAINVHKELGPGLLEAVYQSCMLIELRNIGIKVQSEVLLPIFYRGQRVHEDKITSVISVNSND